MSDSVTHWFNVPVSHNCVCVGVILVLHVTTMPYVQVSMLWYLTCKYLSNCDRTRAEEILLSKCASWALVTLEKQRQRMFLFQWLYEKSFVECFNYFFSIIYLLKIWCNVLPQYAEDQINSDAVPIWPDSLSLISLCIRCDFYGSCLLSHLSIGLMRNHTFIGLKFNHFLLACLGHFVISLTWIQFIETITFVFTWRKKLSIVQYCKK